MRARKIAISVPAGVLAQVDRAARERGDSRSGYISRVLVAVAHARTDAAVVRAVNALFADPEVDAEQRDTARAFLGATNEIGTRW
jgi:metal-responsive CopG/Arc/MetJ family transcriptional regulator